MLFTPQLVEKILAGEKTQTRRLVKPGECLHERAFIPRDEPQWTVYTSDPLAEFPRSNYRVKWQVGRTYAVCPGRGKQQVARIRMMDIWQEPVQLITMKDAVAEGVGMGVGTLPGGGTGFANERYMFKRLWNSINKKPGTRWDDNPWVWVLCFELAAVLEDALADWRAT